MGERTTDRPPEEEPGFRVWRGRPYVAMPTHMHDQVEINYTVEGRLTYLLAGSVVSVKPGRLSLFWAGMPHSVVGGSGVETFYWAYVPLVWVMRLGLPAGFMRRIMGGEMVSDARPSAEDGPMLERWSTELPGASEVRRRLIVREVEARVMRLALAHDEAAERDPDPARRGPMGKVIGMARFVAENHAGPLPLDDVARYVGLHPNYAMTLFHRHYGMTLSSYLTRLRVCRAQHLLLSTDTEISRVAFEAGFGSISRFYEAFKGVSGQTPRQYRLHPGPR